MRQLIFVASVNCLELPADGHFAWDVRWQGLKRLRKNSGQGRKDVPQGTSGAKDLISPSDMGTRLNPCPSCINTIRKTCGHLDSSRSTEPT